MAIPRRGAAPAQAPAQEKKKPVMSVKCSSDRTTSIECAVWGNQQDGDNGSFTAYSITINRSYRKEDGSWTQSGSFRPHDVPVLQFLLSKCWEWILAEKAESTGL